MRQDKTFLLDEVVEKFDQHGSFVLAEYQKISANDIASFRNVIADLGGDVHMVKKRIFVKAAAAAGMEFDSNILTGHLALIFSGSDSVEATKAVVQFGKDSSNLKVLGGRIDQQLYTASEVAILATLPSLQEMRAQLLGVFQAPAQQTVGAMQSLVTAVIYCLQNKCEKDS